MMLSWLRRFAYTISCSILAIPAFAGVTGAIGGRIVDPSGALVRNAVVTLTSTETAAQLTATTGSDGEYHFLALPVGHYKLRATFPGFAAFEEENIKIDANDVLRIDVEFKLVSQAQSVEVQANALHVETTSTQIGTVIGSTTMQALPLNGRSYTDLLGLQAGVAPATASTLTVSFVPGLNVGSQGVGNLSINGAREDATGYVVNGGSVEDPFTNGTSVIPNLDSIQEFRLLTSNFDAEYGHFGGGVVNVVTKAGTNSLHGSAFLFARNQNLDANNFFNKRRGAFSQYQPGGTIGGPIKRDRAFFFVDYQGTRSTIGGSTGLVAVPTTDERNGIFNPPTLTGSVNGAYWANILSQRLGRVVTPGEAYTSVFPNGLIPQAAWSVPSKNLLAFYPQPDAQGNFSGTNNTTTRDDRGGTRVDLIGQRLGTLSAYYFIEDITGTNAFGNNLIPGWPSGTVGRDQQVNLGDIKTFGSNAVNEARLNYSRYSFTYATPLGGPGTAQSVGIPYAKTGASGVPHISISGIGTQIGLPPATFHTAANTYEGLENFSKVVGAHNLKFGGEYDYTQWYSAYDPSGGFFFFGNETGNAVADFLLGAPSFLIQPSTFNSNNYTKYTGVYGQDSWRATPNLTLNFGMRWEVSLPWYEKANQYATIIPGEQSVIYPTAPVGLVYPGDKGVSRGVAPTRWHNFSPRVGLAYAPSLGRGGSPGQMSIRASYGIFYTSISSFGTFFNNVPPPFAIFYFSPAPTLLDAPYTNRATGVVNHPFPFTPPTPGDTNINFRQFYPIANYPFLANDATNPYSQVYSLSLQEQLGKQDVLTITYTGSQTHHLPTNVELNPGSPALCLSLSHPSDVAPGTQTCGPNGENSTYKRANGTVVASTRPYGPSLGSTPMIRTVANSNYNALAVSVNHEWKSSTFLAAYTWGKSMDNSSSVDDQGLYPFNQAFTYGLSSFDISQNFVISYNVQLPFAELARGRWSKVTGGWELTGITRLSTGFPIRINENDDRSLLGMGGVIQGSPDVPNFTPGPLKLGHGPLSGQPYFNTSLFSKDVLGQFGNSNPRFFHGPGISNFNTVLVKNVNLPEHVALQFRAEFYNVFNHPQFFNPSGSINSGRSFGSIQGAKDPRIGQLAVRATF